MRIGIEAQRLFRPNKHGMDRVALELIKKLQQIDKKNEYFIFVKPDIDRNVIQNTENFTIVEVPGGPYPIWEQFQLPKVVEEYQCDVLHCTSNTAPLKVGAKLVTTVHDVIYREENIVQQLLSSASWYQKIGNLYRRILASNVVRKSDQLITVSHFEKENIKNIFQLEDHKIKTVHNAVTQEFKTQFSNEVKMEVKLKYNLPEEFILHIGNKDPRKNTSRVLDAFYELKLTQCKQVKLVIVGINEDTLDEMLERALVPFALKRDILLTGYVSDEDLPVLYCLSTVFLFPSLREGFGIPILEAMATGTAVITSNVSSMPEVSGNAAYLIDPNNTLEITSALEEILLNEKLRQHLVQKGLRQIRGFSWDQSAKKVLKIYQQLNAA